MAFAAKRELAALADHQYFAELRCTDSGRGPSAFADLFVAVHRRVVSENGAKRQQVGIAIKHHATVDLRDAFQNSRRKNIDSSHATPICGWKSDLIQRDGRQPSEAKSQSCALAARFIFLKPAKGSHKVLNHAVRRGFAGVEVALNA